MQTLSQERHLSLARLRGAWRVLVTLALALAISLPATGWSPTSSSSLPSSSIPPSAKVDASLLKAAERSPAELVRVIVREASASSQEAEGLVAQLGGRVTHELPIISSFSAMVRARQVMDLARSDAVTKVWADGKVRMASDVTQLNSSQPVNQVWKQTIRLPQARSAGFNGTGVTVAVLDTGVSQAPDLDGRVLARVDLTDEQDGWDHFGHGTHMSGIIAGDGGLSDGKWAGVAPKARLVSVKVAGEDGSTDVSVVIAGLQWVVSHQSRYNIKVLNLSFGTDSTQSYLVDPLDYAVEQAWFAGITVVVASGNRGPDAQSINKPADDPYVITVGAADLNGTQGSGDDEVASFSSRGPTQDGLAKPVLVAPGITLVSIRDDGSTVDQAYPAARVGPNYFKGTGTSQAAAVISGVVALMYQANPSLTPDVVKRALRATANKLDGSAGQGAGLVDAYAAVQAADNNYYAATPANVGLVPSTGAGSIEASRGSLHVYADLPQDGLGNLDADGRLDLVRGEIDVLGNSWNATGWLNTGWSATGWSATAWASVAWSATGWSSTGWAATSWSGTSWSATGWDATGWSATEWSGIGWSSTGWSGPMTIDSTGWSGPMTIDSTGWSAPVSDVTESGDPVEHGKGNGYARGSLNATGWS